MRLLQMEVMAGSMTEIVRHRTSVPRSISNCFKMFPQVKTFIFIHRFCGGALTCITGSTTPAEVIRFG